MSTSYIHIYVDTSESPFNLTYQRPKEKFLMLMGRREVGSLPLQTDLCQLQDKLTKESEMPFDERSRFVYVLKGSCWALVKLVYIIFLGAMMSYHVNHFFSLGPRLHFFQICLVCSFLLYLFW